MLQVQINVYLNSAFATMESPMTGYHNQLSHCMSEAVSSIINALCVSMELVEAL